MATLKINLENGFFSDTNGRYVNEFTPTYVDGNGWKCSIREDGSIICEAIRNYSDGIHSMRYVISKNGFARLTLKVEGQPLKTLRKGFVLPRGSKLTDGTLGLAGGYVDGRYAFFRDADFTKFLEKFGLTAVKHEDPNREYVVRNARYGGGECHSDLVSDGIVTENGHNSGNTADWREANPGTCAYEGETSYSIKDATWAIHSQNQDEGDCHNHYRILYTQVRNIHELEASLMSNTELAQYAHKHEQEIRFKKFEGVKVSSIEDIKNVLEKISQIAPKMEFNMPTEEETEIFFKSFHNLDEGDFFYVAIGGPMSNNPETEYEVTVRCGDGYSYYLKELKIAEIKKEEE